MGVLWLTPSPGTLGLQARKVLGGFAPKNLSNNHEIHLIIHAIEQCKFANRPRARAASRDRSIEQESIMSEEKS